MAALSFARPEDAKPPVVSCGGKKDAASAVIYLHGVDPPIPTSQEKDNRRLMEKLADELGFALALVRSETMCSPKGPFAGRLCWPREPLATARASFATISSKAAACMRADAKVGVVGFSNAGYLLNKLAVHCQADKASWLLSISAGGSADMSAVATTTACPPLALLTSRQDGTSAAGRQLAAQLRLKGRSVSFEEHPGAHEIPERETRQIIKRLIEETQTP